MGPSRFHNKVIELTRTCPIIARIEKAFQKAKIVDGAFSTNVSEVRDYKWYILHVYILNSYGRCRKT